MHYTKITKWEGQVGSNLFQLAKAIHLAKCIGSQVILPKLENYNLIQAQLFITKKRLGFLNFFSKRSRYSELVYEIPYFSKSFHNIDLGNISDISSSFNQNDRQYSDLEAHKAIQASLYSPRLRMICKENILPILKKSIHKAKKKPHINKKTVVVHISAESLKPVPPFSYIEKVLDTLDFNKIIICGSTSENILKMNPLREHLVLYCKNKLIDYDAECRSLAEDIDILLSANNVIVTDDSKLVRIVLLSSKNIQEIYIPRITGILYDDVMMKAYTGDIMTNVRAYRFEGYYNQSETWIVDQERKKRIASTSKDCVILDSIT